MVKYCWIAATLCVAAGCGQWRGADFVVESGGCCGLNIGQSVNEVVDALRARGVYDVSVDVENPIRVTSTAADKISTLSTASGICVTDHSGFAMDLAFDDAGVLNGIRLSPAAQGNSLGLHEGQEREGVIERLKDEVGKNGKLAISNCLPTSRSVQLARATQDDVAYLASYRVW